MKNETLTKLLSWMRGTDLVEVSYRRGELRLELRLEGANTVPETPFPTSSFMPVASPGVGVFRWGAPGKARRADEGASVAAGDVLGVIETGGSPVNVTTAGAGRVAKVLIEDGKAVEFGQPLFLISP
ncbi:MAG: hypothetical protein HY078_02485 [Elusimicrobia bacterium]|nr:hypothetical protein [Elusimicrobiota bacterium]